MFQVSVILAWSYCSIAEVGPISTRVLDFDLFGYSNAFASEVAGFAATIAQCVIAGIGLFMQDAHFMIQMSADLLLPDLIYQCSFEAPSLVLRQFA